MANEKTTNETVVGMDPEWSLVITSSTILGWSQRGAERGWTDELTLGEMDRHNRFVFTRSRLRRILWLEKEIYVR